MSLFAETERLLARARNGEEVTVPLVEAMRALDELPFSNETFALKRVVWLALLGCGSRDGLCALIERELRNGAVRGLLLPEGDPLRETFPENPWNIPPDASLPDAIAQVWRACPDAARLMQELQRRTLGLALIDRGGALSLGYLLIHEMDEAEMTEEDWKRPRPAFDRLRAFEWEPFGDFSLNLGAAPLTGEPRLRQGAVIPPPLRDFYRVHAGWEGGMWNLATPENLMLWSEMIQADGFVRTEDENERRRADELLYFFSYGDDRSDLFDLSANEPLIRAWGDGELYQGAGRSFGRWLNERLALFLRTHELDDEDDS